MKLINVHGMQFTTLEEMLFSKHLANKSIAMNVKSKEERFLLALNWLKDHLKVSDGFENSLLNRQQS